jgi:hypothetical protein
LRQPDKEEDTAVIAAMLHNRKLDRFHPIFFYASPKPSECDDDVCRFRSYGHHTEGFVTRAEADADIASDCADGKNWNSGVDFEWSGEGSPASTYYFARSQDPSCRQEEATAVASPG